MAGPTSHGGYDVTVPLHAFASAAEAACDCGHCIEAREVSHTAEAEMRLSLAETRRIGRLDEREVSGLIHEIDH